MRWFQGPPVWERIRGTGGPFQTPPWKEPQGVKPSFGPHTPFRPLGPKGSRPLNRRLFLVPTPGMNAWPLSWLGIQESHQASCLPVCSMPAQETLVPRNQPGRFLGKKGTGCHFNALWCLNHEWRIVIIPCCCNPGIIPKSSP